MLSSKELVLLAFYGNFSEDWMWNVIWQYEEKPSLLCFHHCVAWNTINIHQQNTTLQIISAVKRWKIFHHCVEYNMHTIWPNSKLINWIFVRKVLPQSKGKRAVLISISLALSLTPVYTVRLRIWDYCTSYPHRDGQAELTWVAGCILRWFICLQTITNPSTNRA